MRKPCRCLLRDEEAHRPLLEIVNEVLETLAPEARADDAAYAARLARCRACERLLDGTCALCGCYVEVRAAKKAMRCPDVPARW